MRVRVLGPIEVDDDNGQPVALGAPQDRAVLALLALRAPSVVPLGTIVDALWGDDPPASATRTVQTLIHRLRKTLGSGVIDRVGSGYRLASGVEVDAAESARLAVVGREALTSGSLDAAVTALRAAADMSRGDPLPELPDTPVGVGERRHLQELRDAIVDDLADARLALGEARDLIPDLEAAVAEQPYSERRWGRLMLALYRDGRQADALAAYQRARARLVDDLGVEPGPDLRDLEAKIIGQDLSLSPPAPVASGSGQHDFAEASWRPPSDEGRLFGREEPLRRALEAWDGCQRSIGRRLLLVRGDAGIGKTRLAAEVARQVIGHGGLVLHGSCDPGSGSWAPITEALDRLAAELPGGLGDLLDGVDPIASRVTRLVDAGGWEVPGLDAETEADRLHQALSTILERVARAVPTMLILDDLHWASAPTARLLLSLIRHPGTAPLLILGTARPHTPERTPFDALLPEVHRSERATVIDLGGLDIDAVRQVVEAHLDQLADADTERLVVELADTTGGNPFFAAALITYLRDGDLLVRRSGRWVLDGGVLDRGLPTAVADVLAARLDVLDPAARAVLEPAAVFGATFPLDAVTAVTDIDPGVALDACEQATAAGLLTEAVGYGQFTFTHDLIRQVILGRISTTRQVQWHWGYAQVLSVQPSVDRQDVAWHATQGLAPADATQAVTMLRSAATEAMHQASVDVALAHLDVAGTVLDAVSDVGLVADVLTDRAIALLESAVELDDPVYLDACTAAEAASLTSQDPERILRAHRLEDRQPAIVNVGVIDGRRIAAVDRAIRYLEHLGVGVNERTVLAGYGTELCAYDPDPTARTRFWALARSLVTDGTPVEVREMALTHVCKGLWYVGHVGEAVALARELVDSTDPMVVAKAQIVLGVAHIENGNIDQAQPAIDLLRFASQTYGDMAALLMGSLLAASAATTRGDIDSIQQLRNELSEFTPAPRTRWQYRITTALIDGVLAGARRPVEPLGPRWLEYGDALPNMAVLYQVVAAWAYTLDGDEHEAAALWSEVDIDEIDRCVFGIAKPATLVAASELAVRYGSPEQARHLHDVLAPHAHQLAANPIAFGPVDLSLAILARHYGDLTAARTHITDAAAYSAAHGITGWDRRIARVAASLEPSDA